MNNKINFKLISLIVAMVFFLQGCTIWRTINVDEQLREISRKPAELSRKYKIVLASQASVRVYEDVKMGNEILYDKFNLVWKGRGTDGQIIKSTCLGIVFFPIPLLAFIISQKPLEVGILSPCPGPGCPIEKTVTEHKGTTIKHENINYKEITVSSGDVAVYIDGKHRTDIPIDKNGNAKLNIGLYPVDLKGIDEVEVKYKYKKAVASTSITNNVYAEAMERGRNNFPK